ncbi:MAG TPA: NAD(P)/FAD-dependent oxidoreductase [Steroidobacteraceae bacterium]|jgi:flavin-dependent dehydrogenase|nr:NAD(P)/FAD-dependent oxidoreductase [Steroidobacteraceae bacterium]
MKFAAEHDVMVLGAGPAGTSAAIQLAQMGLDVGIVERCRFPRSHVGICISDETVALIKYLGLGHEFHNAQFWRRNLTAVRWGDLEARLVPQKGYHVDRAVFDPLMVCKSRFAGAKVYQPIQAIEVKRLEDTSWGIAISSDERRLLLKAHFIVDAAGRRPATRGTRIKDGPPLISVHANWTLRHSAEFDGLIEAGEEAWLWYAQTARDRAVVSVFCDPRRLRTGKEGGIQAKYSELLREFRSLNLEQLGRQCSDPKACDATSDHAENPIGDDYIRLGDSCFTVDPLSSQGVHLALQSGLQGAVVVNTILRKPQNMKAAQHLFRMRIADRVRRHAVRTKQEYARVSAACSNPFWRERGGDAAEVPTYPRHPPLELPPRDPLNQVAVSPYLTLDKAPAIDGVFVEFRQVIRHPNIDGAIAYVEGVDLVRLLGALPEKFAYCDIPKIWQGHAPLAVGERIASWLWNKRILVPAS